MKMSTSSQHAIAKHCKHRGDQSHNAQQFNMLYCQITKLSIVVSMITTTMYILLKVKGITIVVEYILDVIYSTLNPNCFQ